MMDAATSEASDSDTSLFATLSTYDFTADPAFPRGLSSILCSNPNATPSETESLTTRAQCFYYARQHGINIDVGAYEAWKQEQRPRGESSGTSASTTINGERGEGSGRDGVVANGIAELDEQYVNGEAKQRSDSVQIEGGSDSDGAAPYPVSFNELVELISSGKPIPGIKDIPDTVLEGQESAMVANKRRKPWERAAAERVDNVACPEPD